ncbi:probable rRNA-processing protein EBP2 homolog isoform X1 [Amborella trichopoda]|uniref:probable rRNA-processing protein EBP2 homolog isoform X1 n=2 Tax=Amborella trichopoda TaxID=13333 RepID=UPI0005D46646|nr:probable rRNA-processing protein EBP2 homolog isoform X1 [Amborella trichopoda]XP_020526998.1 probable rRNA-processing protein EBP2 homolog isoform X1 [Amborella trichopoda]XP_020526999.1 probable rRNA-processing protein EBP2 homolog isoform X1 [Amborella trichopoda]|eukprot:XP_006850917.2 probable rRNA-processing protein EBP2 homolog isoform X1 [Amborella trichopoda]
MGFSLMGSCLEEIAMEPDSEEMESEYESEEVEEDVPLMEPSKDAIYNAEGLHEKLEDIAWPKDIDWIQKLSIDVNLERDIDVNDDLAREMAFYTQALEGTRQAFGRLQSMAIPFLRPPDYYAEMVKSDSHMVKVKGKLLFEKKKLEEAEERRKAREAKRIAKEVQAEKLKERAKQKKHEIESVKKWRKQRQNGGTGGSKVDLDFGFEEGEGFERPKKMRPGVAPGDRSGGNARHAGKFGKGSGKGGKSREYRNTKFGHGGKKGLKRQNNAESANDIRGFNKGTAQANKKRKSRQAYLVRMLDLV